MKFSRILWRNFRRTEKVQIKLKGWVRRRKVIRGGWWAEVIIIFRDKSIFAAIKEGEQRT